MSATKTKVQAIIDENPVVVFSKSWCSYSRAAKSLLTELGAKFYTIELDQIDDGAEMQEALKQISSQSTVPNIFIGQKHIGGNSDLQAKKNQLPDLLRGVSAI